MGSNPNNHINSNNNRQRLGNIINRVFESAGPDGKVRGTPQQIIDKYQALARDAQLAGDWVAAESFLQHSEHYSRMLGDAQAQQNEARQGSERSDGPRDEGRSEEFQRDDGRMDDGRREAPRGDGPADQTRTRADAQPQPRPQQPPTEDRQPSFPSGLATIDPEDDEFGGLIETPESAGKLAQREAAPDPVPNGAGNGAHHGDPAPGDAEPRPAPKRGRPRRKAPSAEADAASPAD